MFEEIFSKSLELDTNLIHKFGCLLECESIDSALGLGSLLIEPLIPNHCSTPKHCRLSSLQIDVTLLKEWKDMLQMLHNVNEDRKNLRQLASHLLAVISSGSIAKNAFEAFVSRSTLMHYQLQKVFLENQRKKIETLEFQLNSFETKETSDSSTQTENSYSIPEPNWNLDFSIASDTTTSPINKSIDIVNLSQIEMKKGQLTERSSKKSFSRISVLPIKQKKKTEEPHLDKQIPPIRKNQLRKTGKA